jgi:hypothetical protein
MDSVQLYCLRAATIIRVLLFLFTPLVSQVFPLNKLKQSSLLDFSEDSAPHWDWYRSSKRRAFTAVWQPSKMSGRLKWSPLVVSINCRMESRLRCGKDRML